MAEQNDNLLPGGLRFFNAAETAPEFVMGTLVITPKDFVQYLKDNPELLSDYEGKKQLKVQLLVSKQGKLYGKVDNYKKEDAPEGRKPVRPGAAAEKDTSKKADSKSKSKKEEDDDDDLPF